MTDRHPTKRRIMIVDDHKGITALWRVMLERTGCYTVREENRSAWATRTARDFQPEVLLLDMDMPDLNGSEVAADLRADEFLNDTPIIFLTSLVSPCEVAAGKRIEGYPCLAKPTSLDDLVRVIEENLAQPLAA